jgi:AIPR protein
MDNNHFGIFHCEGVSVVNGAQTVGVIGEALGDQDPEALPPTSRINDAWIHVRITPLEGCPAEFDRKITEATNFQNAVEHRDFAALDSTQHRIATEFALDRKKYAYRSGDERPREEEGCTLTEATQALACAHSMDLAVQAKREIGLLWADTTKQPYTDLFNHNTNSVHLWKAVMVMRAVEDVLARRASGDRRTEVIATHLNRAILNLVFSDSRLRSWKSDPIEPNDTAQRAAEITPEIFGKVVRYIKEKHDGDYLASLSKNRDKCVALGNAIISPVGQRDLFDR